MFSFAGNGKDSKKEEQVRKPLTIEEYRERLELLYDVAQQANSFSEVSNLLQEILLVIEQLLHASASSLLLIDQEKRELYAQAAGGMAANTLKQLRLNLDTGITGWVARHAKPTIVNDVAKDKRFNKEIDNLSGFVTKSMIAAPIFRGREIIGVIEALNKSDGATFTERDLSVLTGFAATEALILLVSMAGTAINNIKLHQDMMDGYKSTVEALVTAADAKDPYACGHSRRVSEYTLMAARNLNFPEGELRILEFGALLHDIGKIGIDDSILRRPRPLTDEEWYVVRKHPMRGANIIAEIPFLEKAKDIVLSHHERYDGTGYPQGLKGENIPMGARIVAVADAFDTMTTDHAYRPVLNTEAAVNELIAGTGTQFCPVAVGAFINELKKNKELYTTSNATIEAMKDAGIATAEVSALPDVEDNAPNSTGNTEEAGQDQPFNQSEITGKEPTLAQHGANATQTVELSEPARDGESPEEEKELFHGDIQIRFDSTSSFAQIRQCKECLRQMADLKIVLDSWSDEEGTAITVRTQQPIDMERILSLLPAVQSVEKRRDNVVIITAAAAVVMS
ncbi:MAG: HD domain-containing protein [Dehalococcoidales bacterium]|nr:HD domain-containing protein [Dehalococcoidales bacterium]